MKATGWLKGLEVTADGAGIVSHAGLALLRALADKTGLTGGLSKALASDRPLVHDRGRVLADLACAIADGAEVISDFRVMSDQHELFGLVASVPTCWRALHETAAGGDRALARISAAVSAARRQAWAAAVARHGALPGIQIADKMLEGVTCIRLDASVVPAHSPALATRSWRVIWRSAVVSSRFRRVADVKALGLAVRWHLDSSGGRNTGWMESGCGSSGAG